MSVHEAHFDLWFFAREKAVVLKHVLKNDKLSTVAAVNESQNSEIEMVSWQVRLTDQVRYHQHSSSVFVGARLNGLLALPALKLKNWKTEKSQIPWKQGLTPPHTHTPISLITVYLQYDTIQGVYPGIMPTTWISNVEVQIWHLKRFLCHLVTISIQQNQWLEIQLYHWTHWDHFFGLALF